MKTEPLKSADATGDAIKTTVGNIIKQLTSVKDLNNKKITNLRHPFRGTGVYNNNADNT